MSAAESTIAGPSTKEAVLTLLNSLPENCSFEDVQYGLLVLEKTRRSREQLDRGEGIPHEEVKRQVMQWVTK